MATSKLHQLPVPFDVPEQTRVYLDDQMRRLTQVANDTPQATQTETISGDWTFDGTATFNGAFVAHETVQIETTTDDYMLYFKRGANQTGGFYHDATSQYWLNNLGQTVIQNVYGTKDITLGGNMAMADDREIQFGATANGDVSLEWQNTAGALVFDSVANANVAFMENNVNKFFITHTDNRVEVHDGYALRVLDSADTDYLDITTTAAESQLTSSQHINLLPASGHRVQVLSGRALYVLDSTNTKLWEARHDGTNSIIKSSSGAFNYFPNGSSVPNMVVANTVTDVRSGSRWRAFNAANTYYSDWQTIANATTSAQNTWLDCSHGGKFRIQAASIADDATATFDIGTSYAMVFILNSYNGTTYGHCGFAGANAPIDYGSGSNVVYGATNPDIDTKVNVWPSASGTMSIKNRMGSTRSFWIFSLEP